MNLCSAYQRILPRLRVLLILVAAMLMGGASVLAQWQTQSIPLKAGWNAVYLHVDPSHATIEDLVAGGQIEEVWLWQPAQSPDRFISDPQSPVSGQDWASWHLANFPSDSLTTLIGNAAYLVRSSATITWDVKGKPVAPRYDWTSRGVNFIGFSTPSGAAPLFSNFLSPAQRLAAGGEFYRYDDGDNDLTPSRFNALFNSVSVDRGKAYWIRHENEFNRYFGAFEVVLQNPGGIHFGEAGAQYSVRIRNKTSADLTVSLNRVASEAAPDGETAISGDVPLLLRGALNTSDLTYASASLSSQIQVTLKPREEIGSEVELVLGVDRTSLTGSASELYGSILRLTDSLGYTQVDLPVSASPSDASGLWVGSAVVNQVRHYLKNYEKDLDGNAVQQADGSYNVTSTRTDLGAVARPFNLRLIVHKAADSTKLLQRVYYGLNDAKAEVLATQEGLLDATRLASARRISSAHLPFSEGNAGWNLSGQFAQGQAMTATVALSHNDHGSNPFLHSFHPDHDNLDATFENLQAQGAESYGVDRAITLTFAAPGSDFDSLVSGGNRMTGQYNEAITFKGVGAETLQIDTAGGFSLVRISRIDSLTTQ